MSKPHTTRERMVHWFSPRVLAQTGVDVFVSGILGRHADFRRLEGLASTQEAPLYDYRHDGSDDFWLDYLADTGDGWDSTYAVAHHVSQNALEVCDLSGAAHATTRGRVLIFGGDQVYPMASRDLYQRRLIEPYEEAARDVDDLHKRDVYALPGNHDWYDSLVAFTRLFCAQRHFAGSPTRQTRSYFALRLPHNWWLLGTDIQLDSDIDDAQYRFFESVAGQMRADDRIILCVAEPFWILREKYGEKSLGRAMRSEEATQLLGKDAKESVRQLEAKLDKLPFTLGDARFNERPLEILEQEVLKRRISVYISGDFHHYRRFATKDQSRHKITAGGGGAFLHPTHDLPEGKVLEPTRGSSDRFKLQPHSFPSTKTSRWLCWRNLAFPFSNASFGWILAVLYLIAGWPIAYRAAQFVDVATESNFWHTFGGALQSMTPGQLLVLLALYAGAVLMTDTHSRIYRVLGGVLHASVHVFIAFVLGVLAARWVMPMLYPHIVSLIGAGVFIGLIGALVGGFVWGAYLLISLNVFGRHSNEAFSSLRIADYKNFLRLRITSDGQLWIYPIGIEHVSRPQRWWRRARRGSTPRLIEGPLKVAPAPTSIET